MLSVKNIESKGYYIDLAKEDYYLKGGEPPGKWVGQGAAALRLSGQIRDQDFHHVMDGYGPDGKRKLVQNAGDSKRAPGWDLTFSAPKTVSTVWSQADGKTRRVIQDCQEQAVRKALDWVETQSITRRGKGGTIKEPAKLIIATFEHGTSRAQDPQLHTHALIMNAAVRGDGSTGAIESRQFYDNQMAAGALYRAELAKQLGEQLGYHIEQTGKNRNLFEIGGVDPALVEEFSKRRQAIEEALNASGNTSAKAAEIAALDTRHHKGHVARQDLFKQWQEMGRAYGYQPPSTGREPVSEAEQVRRGIPLLESALDALTDRDSTFTERDLIRKMAESAPSTGVGADVVKQVAALGLASQAVVRLGRVKDDIRYTTRELLELEQAMLRTVQQSAQASVPGLPQRVIGETFMRYPTLREDQYEALRYLANTTSRIKVVEGWAGTGKTFMLHAAREMWEKAGYKVYGAALAAKAAGGLQDGAGIQSQTLHRLLSGVEKGFVPLDKKSVVVIDEAGMVGTRQLAKLIAATETAGAHLVLTGDAQQLQAIQAGGGFKKIAELVGSTKLTHITRQTIEWMREAVVEMIHGNAARVLQEYAEHGALTVSETWRDARRTLIEQWKGQGVHAPHDHLILAAKNIDVLDLNQQAQAARAAAGLLGTQTLKINGQSLRVNDRLLFTRNSTQVKNGQFGVLEGIAGQTITVRLDGGNRLQLNTAEYDDIQLGYAMTTHKAQGDTRQNSYVLVGGNMQDQELSYVQLSRSKCETWLFTDRLEAGDDLARLARRMGRSRQKHLAASYLPTWQQPVQGQQER